MKKLWIGIIISMLLIVVILIAAIRIEKRMTEKSLLAKNVSAQEVKDTTPPVIILNGSKQLTIKQGQRYTEPGYSAIDDVDGSIVNRVIVSKQTISNNQYKLIYTVADKAGNVARQERIINIKEPNVIKQEDENEIDNEINNTITLDNTNNEIETGANKQNTGNNNINNTTSNNNVIQNNKNNISNTSKPNNNKNQGKTDQNVNKKDNTKNNTDKKENKKDNKKDNSKGVIYLTFDDGPTSSSTPKILDILKKHNVKATFFILNYNSKTEALVKREVAEGHSVGIHGYSHDYKKIYTSEEAYMENLDKLQAKIYKSTGVKTTITRFPGGSSNTISKFNSGIMTRLSKLIVQKGYKYYDWNIDSNDAGGARNADSVYNNVTKNLSKKWRNIVLMHDFSGNKKTIEALERIIEYGKKNGYTFKAITPDTPMMRHKINN